MGRDTSLIIEGFVCCCHDSSLSYREIPSPTLSLTPQNSLVPLFNFTGHAHELRGELL
ncbi:hypothetical protein CIPAW_03G064300 [Carya illinoinensis]|uniref:Uncharacterized protein n=1 Tax=Carya illinoinensis TaxID=32201 RepID=A0A8T1R180_CARIL|nr:hypothetical protein CIPAW_03G064300 [Carya illinoinensis]